MDGPQAGEGLIPMLFHPFSHQVYNYWSIIILPKNLAFDCPLRKGHIGLTALRATYLETYFPSLIVLDRIEHVVGIMRCICKKKKKKKKNKVYESYWESLEHRFWFEGKLLRPHNSTIENGLPAKAGFIFYYSGVLVEPLNMVHDSREERGFCFVFSFFSSILSFFG